MTSAPVRRAQTIRQAKKDYRARGGGAKLSDAEKRKLERGAELLRRADRLKAREARKKEWQEKQAQVQAKQGHVLLGSQRRLDKFGHTSSQFHLGKFFRPPPLLEVEATAFDEQAGTECAEKEALVEEGHVKDDCSLPTSPIDVTLFDSTTQVARDIEANQEPSSPPPHPGADSFSRLDSPVGIRTAAAVPSNELDQTVPTTTKANTFSSFYSDLFDDEVVAELDNAVHDLEHRGSWSPETSQPEPRFQAFPAPPQLLTSRQPSEEVPTGQTPVLRQTPELRTFARDSTPGKPASSAMPPPQQRAMAPPGIPVPGRNTVRPPPPERPFRVAKHQAPSSANNSRPATTDLAVLGITTEMLEDLASIDFVLSQMPAR